MNSHIAIIAKNKTLTLPEDFSIDIDDQNPLFNDTEMFSYPVPMPLAGNRFLFGNIDDPFNVDRPVAFEHTPMKVLVDGFPFRSGVVEMADDEEIENTLSMTLTASSHSLSQLINGLSCRDISVKDEILIGEKIGNVTIRSEVEVTVAISSWHVVPPKDDFEFHPIDFEVVTDKYKKTVELKNGDFTPQALGFSYPAICETINLPGSYVAVEDSVATYANGNKVIKPKIIQSFINVNTPYPASKYCNARICYKHYGLDETNSKSTSSDLADPEIDWGENARYPYWVLDADRPQSGICFYVLYFLDCLFDHLGYSFDNSDLLRIEDLKRLCFFTTHCKFNEKTKVANAFSSLDQINEWLKSRGCGGRLEFNISRIKDVQEVEFTDDYGVFHSIKNNENGYFGLKVTPKLKSETFSISADIMNMYANSDNFPDVSVSTIIDSLYNSFGIRFHVDDEKKRVKAYLIRDVFRSQEPPKDFPCQIISMNKVSESYTGFRMKYSNEASSKDQLNNIKNNVKSYNTDYDYVDYPQNATITDQTYSQISNLPRIFNASGNRNVYIDVTTGNAYRIKVAADASTIEELKPVLFEVGAFKGVEIGDCSEINEDHIFEVSSDFVPISFNDVANGGHSYIESLHEGLAPTSTPGRSVLAAYVDEDMEHEFLEKRIKQVLESSLFNSSMDMVLSLVESYDPSSTSDGNSPLQSYDWGLSIAVMRGGGSDAYIEPYDYDYDGFGNSKWRTVSGEYAMSSDSLDAYGNEYDYNGTNPGINYTDGEERFSLKIRAWKQPEWAPLPLIVTDQTDQNGNIIKKVKSRGLFDSFWSEYAHFLLNRRKYRIKAICSSAQLADVVNHWTRRFRIGDLVGYINKLSYSVSAADGLKDLEIEFFVL